MCVEDPFLQRIKCENPNMKLFAYVYVIINNSILQREIFEG